MDETDKKDDKSVRLNIKWGKKETLENHLVRKKKESSKDPSKAYYKPMFKTEEEEKE